MIQTDWVSSRWWRSAAGQPGRDRGESAGGLQVLPDTSSTNSKDTMRPLCAALVAGKRETALYIAELLADAPDAGYIGPDSEVCTPDEQRIAYSFKYLILGDQKEALAHRRAGRPLQPIRRD
jgi:hypothetical protein